MQVDWSYTAAETIAGVTVVCITATAPLWWHFLRPSGQLLRSLVCIARRTSANTSAILELQEEVKATGQQGARISDQNKVILNSMGVLMMDADAEGHVTWVSDPWCDVADAQRDQSLGGDWIGFIQPEEQSVVAEKWFQGVRYKRPQSIDMTFRKTGWKGVAQMSPIRHGESIVGWRAVLTQKK